VSSDVGDTTTTAVARAAALCDLSRWADAIPLLGQVLASDPSNAYAWGLLAQAQLGADDSAAALHAADVAASCQPRSEWPHRLRSLALRGLGRRAESVAAAREAVRVEPQAWQAHAHLARTLAPDRKARKEAKQAAVRALTLAPEQAETHIAFGTVNLAGGHRRAAQAAFERALAIDPQNRVAHNELSRVWLRQSSFLRAGKLAAAADGFATAVRADPSSQLSRRNLDLTLRVFLSRLSYVLFVLVVVVNAGTRGTAQSAGNSAVPVGLLIVPAAFAWYFVHRLSPELRRHLKRTLMTPGVRGGVAFEVVSLLALAVGAALPAGPRLALVFVAGGGAIVARVLLGSEVDRASRAARGLPEQPAFSTGLLWAIAVSFLLAALLLLVSVDAGAGLPGAAVAAGLIGCSLLMFRAIWRRRSRTARHA
jgi:tetratricopeptide (TPR) repeat protein